ncbi:MAG TPA: asparaginase [Mycobacterium sp.]|nr:asparaginase [Mycobacterium sp.]
MSVVVLTTGGTIASVRESGDRIAVNRGRNPIRSLVDPDVRVREVMAVDSSTMSLPRMATIRKAVTETLADARVEGVVVLHGTDTMEETAMFLDLFHADPRPVVLTGAQRPADDPDPDGPHNINAAVATARRTGARDRGVLVVFGGRVLPARVTRKAHTTQLDAFQHYLPFSDDPRATLSWHPDIAQTRVDVVALHPGVDRAHIDASVAAGARGIVVDAMGSGNANPNVLAAVEDCITSGIRVVVTSRVPDGVVEPIYGGDGGGHDLIRVGAIVSPWLRAGQARILLAALVAGGADHRLLVDAFADVVGLGDRCPVTGHRSAMILRLPVRLVDSYRWSRALCKREPA